MMDPVCPMWRVRESRLILMSQILVDPCSLTLLSLSPTLLSLYSLFLSLYSPFLSHYSPFLSPQRCHTLSLSLTHSPWYAVHVKSLHVQSARSRIRHILHSSWCNRDGLHCSWCKRTRPARAIETACTCHRRSARAIETVCTCNRDGLVQ